MGGYADVLKGRWQSRTSRRLDRSLGEGLRGFLMRSLGSGGTIVPGRIPRRIALEPCYIVLD